MHELYPSSSYRSSLTWNSRSVWIQQITLEGIGHISLIRYRTMRSLMRWKANDDGSFVLVLILAPESLWIVLCDHDKVLRHQFWTFNGLQHAYRVEP
jgi:hypothetical protein